MAEEPLYQDDQLKIDYLPGSGCDHLLYIKEGDEDREFIIQRSILREFARTPRGGIEAKIAVFNEKILYRLREQGIRIDGLHVALCQAYAEEERRVRDFVRTQE